MRSPIRSFLLLSLLFFSVKQNQAQNYPAFGPEKEVTITGLTFDAMEPFISPDGDYLFFNNLNDGINTKLYYAQRVNDSTFTLIGELNGTGQPAPPHLDAVADLDSLGNFYWTSTRDYPADLDNLHHGTYSAGNVTNIRRVRGDFNMSTPGWLVMDHGISLDGQFLYFNNARFDAGNCSGPCETLVGVAQKVNDSTFTTLINSAALLQTVNDTAYRNYATCISSDNLELYFTRYPKGTVTTSTLFDICVAVRNSDSDNFSAPMVLFSDSIASLIEAPTLTVDKQIMYYHRKTAASHKIVMRYRTGTTALSSPMEESGIRVYPNPSDSHVLIHLNHTGRWRIELTDAEGRHIHAQENKGEARLRLERGDLPAGIYFIRASDDAGRTYTHKIIFQ